MHFLSSLIVLVFCWTISEAAWSGDSTWNSKYGAYGIYYDSTDDAELKWPTSTESQVSGCFYNKTINVIHNCSGPSVTIVNHAVGDISKINFTSMISSVRIYGGGITTVPDLSQTKLTTLVLVNNPIKLTTENYRGWKFPETLKYLVIRSCKLHWIPPEWISGPNLRIVSFDSNELFQVPNNIFGKNLPSLIYIDFGSNKLKKISKHGLKPLSQVVKHINLENNQINRFEDEALSQMKTLQILEINGNNISNFYAYSFWGLHSLLHLDLSANQIKNLTKKSLLDMPELIELHLEAQSTNFSTITYDAWSGIGKSLKYLYINDNTLTALPHPLLCEEEYPNLKIIYAQNNAIYNITEYETKSFPRAHWLYRKKYKEYTPFSTCPNIEELDLSSNQIVYVNETDFALLRNLKYLYLQDNKIRDDTIEGTAFGNCSNLIYINLADNLLQYIPDALRNRTVLPAIETLILSSNRLTFLETGTFSNLSTIITIDLSSNLILTIENKTFPSQIQTINLNYNRFRFLHESPFSFLYEMRALYLRSNKIDNIPLNAFSNTTSLETLNLQNNGIPEIRMIHFENCLSISSVYLSSNEIGWIEDGTFQHIPSMTTLSLSNNKLSLVPLKGTFTGKRFSQSLDLSSNRIVALPSGVFHNLIVGDDL